jgi:hypothetical protein
MSTATSEFETVPPEEPAAMAKLGELLNHAQKALPQTAARRGQHPKGHGCLWGSFLVRGDLPPELQTQVFVPNHDYVALVRFSNGRTDDDTQRDAHGMAIKLLEVQGPRAIDEGEMDTQDFILADGPIFFARNVSHMLDFVIQTAPVAAGGGGKSAAELAATSHPAVATFTKQAPPSPFMATYWSQTPYLCGQIAVKYVAQPTVKVDFLPQTSGDKNFSRLAMEACLAPGQPSVKYTFFAQMKMPDESVEDATQQWLGALVPVAELTFNSQSFSGPEQLEYCENLQYTPWHAHVQHQPLGGINRARRGIYLDSRQLRSSGHSQIHCSPKVTDRW